MKPETGGKGAVEHAAKNAPNRIVAALDDVGTLSPTAQDAIKVPAAEWDATPEDLRRSYVLIARKGVYVYAARSAEEVAEQGGVVICKKELDPV